MGGCKEGCQEEFRPANFGFGHTNPKLFVQAQWKWPPLIYVIYRVLVAVYFLVWIVLSGVWGTFWYSSQANRIKWFIYLTNWAFFFLNINLVIQAVVVIIAHVKLRHRDGDTYDKMPWYIQLMWFMYNIATSFGLMVSILYWALIYTGFSLHPVDINTHGVNLAYAVVDLFITGIVIRIYHMIYVVLACGLYVAFSGTYHAAKGTNALDKPYIYSVLNWNKPETAGMYAGIVVAVATPVLWLIVYALFRIRLLIYSAIYRRQSTDPKVVAAEDNPAFELGEEKK